jgi:hypothetical protein
MVMVLLAGCGSGRSDALDVGGDDAGALSLAPGDAASAAALDAFIEENRVQVKFIRVGCSGSCADVEAVATGGHPPYSFAWDNGSTSAARQLCPTSSTTYHVTVTDTGTSGEFGRAPESVQVSLPASVVSCPDGGEPDAGACEPGSYVGTWQATGLAEGGVAEGGAYSANPSGPLTLALALATTGGGRDLVPNGSLVITWDVAAQWTANLSGGLDCKTGTFRAEDPMAAFTVASVAAGTCDVTLTGDYDSAATTLSGQWTASCANGDWGATWTATLMQ